MSNEFVARKGLVIKEVLSGVTENHVLLQDIDGLVKYRTSLNLDYVGANYVYLTTGLTASAITYEIGKMFYDDTNKTASIMIGDGIIMQVGQENFIRVYNNSGSQINNGQVCHISGTYNFDGGVPTIVLANSYFLSSFTGTTNATVSGVATHDIPNGQFGFITNFGLVHDINVGTLQVDDTIYLSDTIPGSFTTLNNLNKSSRSNRIGKVLMTGSTTGVIFVDINNENELSNISQRRLNDLTINNSSSGIIAFSGLSINVNNAKFNVGSIQGWLTDNSTDSLNPTITYINFTGQTAITPAFLLTNPVTYIAIDKNLNIIQSATPYTNSQTRDYIDLGVIVHSNNSTINVINNQPVVQIDMGSQLYDLIRGLGFFNISGNMYYANDSTQINKSGGNIFKQGSNFTTNIKDPHQKVLSAVTGITFNYRLQNSVEYSGFTNIDSNNYDLNGVLTSVANNKFTIQRIALFSSNLTRIQYGQKVYATMADAVAGLNSEPFIIEPNIQGNGLFRCFLVVKQGVTNLSDTAQATFIQADRFGGSAGAAGGLSVTSLQTAYNNSLIPQITTNSTLGPITFKNGIAGDSNKVIEIQTYSDGTVFSVDGTGRTVTTFLTVTGMTSLTGLTRFVFIDGSGNTYYLNDSPVQNDFLIWSGDTWVSVPGIIGVPTDGTYTDGFFDTWVDSTPIANAVDDINEVLKKLAPSKPPELNTKTILLSSSYASATLNKASDGVAVSYLLVSDSNTTDVQLSDMTIVSTGGGFNKYVGANLTGFIDNVSVGSINYPNGNMNTGTTNNNKLTAIEYDYWGGVAGKSDFWPAVVSRINDVFSGLSYGVHTSKISWSGSTEYETTNLLTIYYDNPVTPSGNTLNLSAQTYVTRWISGVPTFSTGDLLAVNFGFTGLVSQVYRPNPISATSSYASTVTNTLSGAQTSGTTISGILNPVVQTSKYVEDILVTVAATNGKGTITTYSNMTIATSQAGKTMRVDTVSNESTRKLSGGIAGNFPVTYGGVYDSGATLLSGSYLYELQMLNGVYRRITGSYINNFPIAGPNYSSDSNTDYRWVMFSYSITTKSSITVTVNGANMSTVAGTQVTDNMKIFIKVEGSTGWLDANSPYPGVGTPIADGDFAMVTASSTASTTVLSKYVTFGAGNYSGTLYVRLGMASGSNDTLTSITVV